ncbi:MAG: DNA internalization-related competence protein ComEC/Rec2 [Myxococcota bacterium]|nr:DNA internalization-related competence protein ComEC/Rec2 [Myxococcota bacterium]
MDSVSDETADSLTSNPDRVLIWARNPLFPLVAIWVAGLYVSISPRDFALFGLWTVLATCLGCFLGEPKVRRLPLLYVGIFGLGSLVGTRFNVIEDADKNAYDGTRIFSALVRSGPFHGEKASYLDVQLVGTSTGFQASMTASYGEFVQLKVQRTLDERTPDWGCGRPGDVIRVMGKLTPRKKGLADEPRKEQWNASNRVFSYFSELKSPDLCMVTYPKAETGWYVLLQEFRTQLATKLYMNRRPDTYSFMLALLIGEKRLMSQSTKDLLQKAGLSHLVAVSGLHFGIAIGSLQFVFLVLCRVLSLHFRGLRVHRWASLTTIPCVFAFIVLTGGNPSCVRAGIMFLLFLSSQLLNRQNQLLSMLTVSVVLILTYDLQGLFDVSVQLSFAALFGIVNYTSHLKIRALRPDFGRFRIFLDGLVGVTVATGLFTMPLVLYHFHWLSLSGFVLNLVATPLMSLVILPALLVGVLFEVMGLSLSELLLGWSESGIELLLTLADSFKTIDWLGFYVAPPSRMSLILVWLSLSFLFHQRKPLLWLAQHFRFVVIFSSVLALATMAPFTDKKELLIHFIPVGQGDTVFLEFPNGQTMLIDTGPSISDYSAAKSVIGPYIRRRGYTQIDAVVITHSDNDHAGGIADVLREFEVGTVYWNFETSSVSGKVQRQLTRTVNLRLGDKLSFGTVKLQVLHPECLGSCLSSISENQRSVVIRLDYGATSALFTGDIGAETEQKLLQHSKELLDVDVLKVPHHGSRSSSTLPFLQAVSPDFSIVMVGAKNRFGHPHAEVYRNLQAFSSRQVLRTDTNGLIRLVSDGLAHRVEVENP